MKHINRSEILTNVRTHIYVYGDDITRQSYQGQGATCGGLVNCYPLTTKKVSCETAYSYFNDKELEINKLRLDRDMSHILAAALGKKVVVLPKIGEGCSKLKEKAPQTFDYLQKCLEILHTIK